ncbi:hypothetical protein Y032_0801g2420 [Ancylostoma ceylanicum]|nr:hypothetical protein Y032_0801g2420 [Ancylostoma ceylanicum]
MFIDRFAETSCNLSKVVQLVKRDVDFLVKHFLRCVEYLPANLAYSVPALNVDKILRIDEFRFTLYEFLRSTLMITSDVNGRRDSVHWKLPVGRELC